MGRLVALRGHLWQVPSEASIALERRAATEEMRLRGGLDSADGAPLVWRPEEDAPAPDGKNPPL
jgi:hypothetical protein